MGFTVTSADISPERFRGAGLAVAADLDASLPFPDSAFDLVLCVEGIEHAENQYHAFREFTRVLAPGGRLVLSTPNPLSLSSRLRLLLSGFDDVAPLPIRHDEPRISAHHINPVSLPFLDLMCRRNGLVIEHVSANRLRFGSILAALFLYPAIWLRTRMILAQRRPEAMAGVHARVQGWLLGPAVLFGRVVVIVARRGAASLPSPSGPTPP